MRWRDANSSEAPENWPDEIRQAYKKFLEVREYTEHQAIYCHLFRRAMRDGKIEHDERLNFPSSYLTKSDYEYWCKADYWTDYEFIGLLTERQPKRIATILDYNETVLSDVGKQAERLHLLLRRARDTRHIEAFARPHDLLVWAKKKRIELPEMLASVAEDYGLFDEEEDQANEPAPSLFPTESDNIFSMNPDQPLPKPRAPHALGTKERESLLKMVIGMGIAGYAHDPEKRRNPTAKEISDDLASQGISLDEDTIRKYLKEGAGLLPQQETTSRHRKPNSASKRNSGTA